MTKPFDYVNAINFTKQHLIEDDLTEKQYNSFLTNRSLSYFPDTVAIANEININHHIDNKLQFDFLLNIVRKRKRFSKWMKREANDDIEVIKRYYGYNEQRAREALSLLTQKQVKTIRQRISHGGRKTTK